MAEIKKIKLSGVSYDLRDALAEDKITELEGNVTIATFKFSTENDSKVINISELPGATKIDWGDGTVNTSTTHTYVNTGTYHCKIYGLTKIKADSFSNLIETRTPGLTDLIIGKTVTEIGENAFEDCSSLLNLVINADSLSINSRAFSNCYQLSSVKMTTGVTSIGNYAFSGCSSLTSVVIGGSVTTIGDGAFYYCSKLTSVVIPDSVTSIGNYAFYDCYLKSITFKGTIPISTTSFFSDFFHSTTKIYVPYGCVEAYRAVLSEGGVPSAVLDALDCEALISDCNNIKIYTETQVSDAKTYAETKANDAKTYAETKVDAAKALIEEQLTETKEYVDAKVGNLTPEFFNSLY